MDIDVDEYENIPDLTIAKKRFLASLGSEYPAAADNKQSLLELLQKNQMVDYYKDTCTQFSWPIDSAWVETATKANEQAVKELEAKIKDAEENLGESEVREANLRLALFYCRAALKDKAEFQFRVTQEKTVGIGQKLNIAFALIRMGFFFDDEDLITRNIEKARSLIEQGGDWEKRNRLKVYEGFHLLRNRQFQRAAEFFLSTVANFNAEELFSYSQSVLYTVLLSALVLPRVELKEKVVDSPEVAGALAEMKTAETYLNAFYGGDYTAFFSALAELTDEMKFDRALRAHVRYYGREMRVRAYQQFLASYSSVTLASMAKSFGVTTEFIESELSHFISLGRLSCKIDAVNGNIETTRPDTKNSQYLNALKSGDLLLGRIQKLSRVIHM